MMPAATAATHPPPPPSATAPSRSSTTAATRCSATDAGLPRCRIALCLSALLDAAEGARAGAALSAGCSVSSRRLSVSVESPGRWAGTAGKSTARAPASVGGSAAPASAPVEAAPVIKRVAPRVVPAAAISCVTATPIESPVIPAPSKASEEADSKPHPERQVRAAKPNSGIRVPSRPRHDGISVSHPRIIRGDVNDLGVGRLNDDRRALVGYDLLRRGLKIASALRARWRITCTASITSCCWL